MNEILIIFFIFFFVGVFVWLINVKGVCEFIGVIGVVILLVFFVKFYLIIVNNLNNLIIY